MIRVNLGCFLIKSLLTHFRGWFASDISFEADGFAAA